MNEKIQQIADKYREEFVCGRYEAFEIALKLAYQSGRDAQRESDAMLFELSHHGEHIMNAIRNNTGEL